MGLTVTQAAVRRLSSERRLSSSGTVEVTSQTLIPAASAAGQVEAVEASKAATAQATLEAKIKTAVKTVNVDAASAIAITSKEVATNAPVTCGSRKFTCPTGFAKRPDFNNIAYKEAAGKETCCEETCANWKTACTNKLHVPPMKPESVTKPSETTCCVAPTCGQYKTCKKSGWV